MDSPFVISQVSSTIVNVSAPLVSSIPPILVIFAALVGLGMLLRYLFRWLNLPGFPGYDTSRGSHHLFEGRSVKPGANGVIDLSKF